MSIEHAFDVPFVAALALKEKQIQQNYRPIIAVHKWFARRPGTLFRALLLSELGERPLAEAFYEANDFPGLQVADPFMGGGTPLIEANRIGCDVQGFDINPMSTWIVREELEHIDLTAYRLHGARADQVPRRGDRGLLPDRLPALRRLGCASEVLPLGQGAELRVLRRPDRPLPRLPACRERAPSENVLVCPACGGLNEVDDRKHPGGCTSCDGPLYRGRTRQSATAATAPTAATPTPIRAHRPVPLGTVSFAIEYHNPARKARHAGRFFKKPDERDLARAAEAAAHFERLAPEHIPAQEIPPGDETDRLHRWGYRLYRDLFNPRQLLALELSCRRIAALGDSRMRHALATNLSDLLRYQNMLCRYDTMALKSLDIFSVHGFPVGLVQCESNVLGIRNGSGAGVGSGGWVNIVDKYTKAKHYCDAPFEVRHKGGRKVQVPVKGEWIGEKLNGSRRRAVGLHCASATAVDLPEASLDAVFTDPPYFGNVQYAELMDFCYVWLRGLVGSEAEGFERESTRSRHELTGNLTQDRDLAHFAEGLSAVYSRMAHALKPGAPLAFTYHHNRVDAYYAVGAAILDARLVCSASLPCPAEMSGSIHIHGTGSSIIDTVLVCRTTGNTRRQWLFDDMHGLMGIVARDLSQLTRAGRVPTQGDTRCVAFGHLTRMAIWKLRQDWDRSRPMREKLAIFAEAVAALGRVDDLLRLLVERKVAEANPPAYSEAMASNGEPFDAVSF